MGEHRAAHCCVGAKHVALDAAIAMDASCFHGQTSTSVLAVYILMSCCQGSSQARSRQGCVMLKEGGGQSGYKWLEKLLGGKICGVQ